MSTASSETRRRLQRERSRTSTDARSNRTRKAIVEAVEALADEGAEELTVAAIARRAGISRGSFYAHYDSIPHLAESLMIEAIESSAQDMEQRMLEATTTSTTLREAFEGMKEHFVQHRALYRAVLELPGADRAFRGVIAKLSAINMEFLRTLRDIPDGVDLHGVAVATAWAHYGAYDSWLRGELATTPELLVETLFELLPPWFHESTDAPGVERPGPPHGPRGSDPQPTGRVPHDAL